ncbi:MULTISPECIES: DUF6526 family protein [Paenibacillus]|uniref:DUF6526 family protein n=1 Tax=Paenibacillus TaxID=44249 RepID=UPI000E2771A5|nr:MULTISPECIES: DUF6526 family protein [unclassified Paenibacillus]RED35074.1 hypothetical protein C7820_4740 [Paenibacillus sp. VMFN-D1]UYO05780.1 hypothetical protein K2F33_07640 [Paenibacillus sp. PSB04]
MKSQNYKTHVRMVPAFHFFLVPLGIITLVASIIHLFVAELRGISLFSSLLFVSVSLMAVMTMIFARRFACKVQDRAIRAEENLRSFALTGRLLDPRLSMNQILALRFAPDEEWMALCDKAVKENLPPERIKRSIKAWKADFERV